MSKFNSGAVKTAQAGTQTVSDSIKRSLESIPDIVEKELEVTAPADEQVQAPMSYEDEGAYDQNLGYSPEGNVLPLGQRANMAAKGELNPRISTAAPEGYDPRAVERSAAPDLDPNDLQDFPKQFPTHRSAPNKQPLVNMSDRAKNMAEGMVNHTIGGNWHFNKAERAMIDPANLSDTPTPEQIADRESGFSQKRERSNSLGEVMTNKVPNAVSFDSVGNYAINPEFARLMSVTTEDHIPNMFLGTPAEMFEEDFETSKAGDLKPKTINPVESAGQLGRQIMYWHDKTQEANGGQKPPALSDQEYKELGAFAIQAYQRGNPNLVAIAKDNQKEDGDGIGTRYILTSDGEAEFARSDPYRKDIFGAKIPPLHSRPVDGLLPENLSGLRPQFKNKRALGKLKMVEESLKNQSQVNYVVDVRRSRIAMAMIIPTMFRNPGAEGDIFGNVFGVGEVALKQAFIKETKLNNRSPEDAKGTAYNIVKGNKLNLLKEMSTIIQNLYKPNYLTYAIQQKTSRAHAMQSDFNPTRNKVVRFATRGQTPTKVIAGSQQQANMKAIFALNLMSEKLQGKGMNDLLMPKQRAAEVDRMMDVWYKMGMEVKQLIDNSIPEETFNRMSEALNQGMQLSDPNFPKAPLKNFGEGLSKNLQILLKDKGEDAPMMFETLMEVVDYMDNMKAGRPHYSSLNAYVDGKTNGIALAAMILGNEKLAFRTGVLRPDDAVYSMQDEEGNSLDVRGAMARFISNEINDRAASQLEGMPDMADDQLHLISREMELAMGNYKELNKSISMIFPYGKELQGMINEVSEHFTNLMGSDPEFNSMVEWLEASGYSMEDQMKQVHKNVISSLFDVFGEETFEGRAVQRASSYLMAAMDGELVYVGPSETNVSLAGKKLDTSKVQKGVVSAHVRTEDGKRDESKLNVQSSPSYASSAGAKNDQIGADGRALSVVVPIHAADAAVVHRSFSGKSMERIKGTYANPDDAFFTQIYDAFKVDVSNYQVVLEEINQNFVDVSMENKDYFELGYEAVTKARAEFHKKLETIPKGTQLSVLPGSRLDFMGHLLSSEVVMIAGAASNKNRGLQAFVKGITPMRAGQSMEAFDQLVGNRTRELAQILNKLPNVDVGVPNSSTRFGKVHEAISRETAQEFLEILFRFSDYSKKTTAFTQKIKGKRRNLLSKISEQQKRTGHGVYQFYAH